MLSLMSDRERTEAHDLNVFVPRRGTTLERGTHQRENGTSLFKERGKEEKRFTLVCYHVFDREDTTSVHHKYGRTAYSAQCPQHHRLTDTRGQYILKSMPKLVKKFSLLRPTRSCVKLRPTRRPFG